MSTAHSYSHVGRRASVGHYAVTADAYRTPGKTHAMNYDAATRSYVGLCGVAVAARSDDHFLQDEPQVAPVSPGHRVTCKRCRKLIG